MAPTGLFFSIILISIGRSRANDIAEANEVAVVSGPNVRETGSICMQYCNDRLPNAIEGCFDYCKNATDNYKTLPDCVAKCGASTNSNSTTCWQLCSTVHEIETNCTRACNVAFSARRISDRRSCDNYCTKAPNHPEVMIDCVIECRGCERHEDLCWDKCVNGRHIQEVGYIKVTEDASRKKCSDLCEKLHPNKPVRCEKMCRVVVPEAETNSQCMDECVRMYPTATADCLNFCVHSRTHIRTSLARLSACRSDFPTVSAEKCTSAAAPIGRFQMQCDIICEYALMATLDGGVPLLCAADCRALDRVMECKEQCETNITNIKIGKCDGMCSPPGTEFDIPCEDICRQVHRSAPQKCIDYCEKNPTSRKACSTCLHKCRQRNLKKWDDCLQRECQRVCSRHGALE